MVKWALAHGHDVSRAAGLPRANALPAHGDGAPASDSTKRAPGGSPSSVRSPSIRRASSRPIARPRPNPPSFASAPRAKRSKIRSRSSARDAGAVVLDDDARHAVARARPGRGSRRRTAPCSERVVEQDAHDLRDAAGIADGPHAVALVDVDRSAALADAHLELGDDRTQRPRRRSTSSLRSGMPGVDAAQVEQLGRQPRQPLHLRLGAGRPARARSRRPAGSARRSSMSMSSITLQRRQRRAQLVRCGGDERAARLLLLAQAPLHRRERPAEVADLVAPAIGRELGLRAQLGRRAASVSRRRRIRRTMRPASSSADEQRAQRGPASGRDA